MSMLRRYSVYVSTLLLAVVAVQVLDMGLCCESVRASWTTDSANPSVVLDDSGGAITAKLLGDEERDRGDAAKPDCLCHLVFTTIEARPAVQAVVLPTSKVIEANGSLSSTQVAPPDHIPL